jgi:sugar phosphate isomerase/epimerase
MELLKPVKAGNIGINYDTGNIRCLTGIDPEKDLPNALDRIVHMHIKDQRGGKGMEQFPALGHGEVDFRRVFYIVRANDFEGPFCLEIEDHAENDIRRDDDVRESYIFLKRFLDST